MTTEATVSRMSRMATIVIPAECLADFRSALATEIDVAGRSLGSSLEGRPREDFVGSARVLREDMDVLSQVLDDDQDATVVGCRDALSSILDGFVRVVVDHLDTQSEYAPVKMDVVSALVGRLRWAVDAAGELTRSVDEPAA